MLSHEQHAAELFTLAGYLLHIAHGHDTPRHMRYFRLAARKARLLAHWHAGAHQPASIGIHLRALDSLRDLHQLTDTLAGRIEITGTGRQYWADQRDLLQGLIDWRQDRLAELQDLQKRKQRQTA